MRFRTCITTLALALALVAALAAAPAGARERVSAGNEFLRGQPFIVTGLSSDRVQGDIVLDGVTYRIAPEARIYEVGRGFVPQGTSFALRTISLSGRNVRGTMMVYSVMVRPGFSTGFATARPVEVSEESRPR